MKLLPSGSQTFSRPLEMQALAQGLARALLARGARGPRALAGAWRGVADAGPAGPGPAGGVLGRPWGVAGQDGRFVKWRA